MKNILCFDIGGTRTRAAMVTVAGMPNDPEYVEREYKEITTPETIKEFGTFGREVVARFPNGRIDGYALAMAASIEDHRAVLESPNVAFLRARRGGELLPALRKALGVNAPMVFVNDMEAALAGEVAAGALRGRHWAFMDTISTGWGGALLVNGVEIATEPGHVWVPVSRGLNECGCGRQDCAEGRYSGGAVRRRIIQEVEAISDARGDRSYQIPKGTDPCAFADAEYRRGEAWARSLYGDVATAIGEIWGSRLNLCPPVERIVYTGTFAEHFFLLPDMLETVRWRMIERSLFQERHTAVTITRAEARHGALFGAARVFERLSATV